jgi:hypothetical protein
MRAASMIIRFEQLLATIPVGTNPNDVTPFPHISV